MADSTGSRKVRKPRPDFPLFPHATGRWAKKVGGRMVYFGPLDDPTAALRLYELYQQSPTKFAKTLCRS